MEWDNREAQENQNQNQNHQREDINNNNNDNVANVVNGGVMYVKVMTDEQLETLRKQIAVYATICEQLVEMHKSLSAHQDLAGGGGGRLGHIYCDPSSMMITSGGHKITARQRWTPTPLQLQILESIFDKGNGTPSKQKIKEITAELTQHGQISETNVYNWFQNRRARSKRKQLVSSSATNSNINNAESEVDTEVDSLLFNEKKTKPQEIISTSTAAASTHTHTYPAPAPAARPSPPHHENDNGDDDDDDMCFHSPEISSELHFLGVFSNPRDDNLTGKMGMTTGSYNLYDHAQDYDMAG